MTPGDRERSQVPCYVGVSPATCGHWIAVAVDDPKDRVRDARATGTMLADWARRGLIVERHTVAEVRGSRGETT